LVYITYLFIQKFGLYNISVYSEVRFIPDFCWFRSSL